MKETTTWQQDAAKVLNALENHEGQPPVAGSAIGSAIVTNALLKRGQSKMGWTCWWIVDEAGNLLNTEPVCTTPDNWHPWFEKHLEDLRTRYLGVNESPNSDYPTGKG